MLPCATAAPLGRHRHRPTAAKPRRRVRSNGGVRYPGYPVPGLERHTPAEPMWPASFELHTGPLRLKAHQTGLKPDRRSAEPTPTTRTPDKPTGRPTKKEKV